MTGIADGDREETIAKNPVDLAGAWDFFIPMFAGSWKGIDDPPPGMVLDWRQRPALPPNSNWVPARFRELAMKAAARADPIRHEIQARAVELRNQLIQIDFGMWAATHPEAASSDGPYPDKWLNLSHRFIEEHLDVLGPDFVEGCRKIRLLLNELVEVSFPFSSSPVGVLWMREGEESPFSPDRIYLDVTDATLADVQRIWTYVDLVQKDLSWGSTRKRRQGRTPGPQSREVSRWVMRAQEVGESAARAEFKAEGDGTQGDWLRRYQWWYRHVRPHLH